MLLRGGGGGGGGGKIQAGRGGGGKPVQQQESPGGATEPIVYRKERNAPKAANRSASPLASLLSFFLLWPAWLFGQQTLRLEQAVNLALAQNPAVRASQAGEDAAVQRWTQARAGYFPEVNYSESFQWGTNPVYVFGSLLEQHRFRASNFDLASLNRPDPLTNFSSQLTVNQPLFDGHKTRYRLRAATAGSELAGEQKRQAEMDVLEAVAEAYLGAVVAQEEARVAEEAFQTAQADLERARALRDAGMTTDADVLSMQVHVAEVEDQRIRARNHLALARARLNDLLAVPLETDYTLTTPLRPVAYSPPAIEQYEEHAASERPEARQAELALRLAETDLDLARAAFRPEVVLHGAFEVNRQSFVSRGGSNWMFGATLRLNLFRGLADRARIAESSFLRTQREHERQQTDSALRLQVRQFFLEFQAAGSRANVASAAVAQAEENHRILANRYEAGLTNATDLLRSQTALSAARSRYLAAVYDQRVAAVRLERAAGSLTPSSEVLQP